MISTVSILVVLALGIFLFLLLPWFLTRWASASARVSDRAKGFCEGLCRIRIALGFLLGLAFGAFLYACYPELLGLLHSSTACLALLFLILLLALFVAFYLAYRSIECGGAIDDPIEGKRTSSKILQNSLYLLLVLLALLVLTLLVRSTGLPLPELLFGTLCGKLILAAILIAVLFLIVRMLELRFCGVKPDTRCCKRDIRAWSIILLILLLAALALIRTCENDIRQKDFDLAMVGVHWDGKYPGESGAHLRWGFRYELTFPQGGFEVFLAYRSIECGGAIDDPIEGKRTSSKILQNSLYLLLVLLALLVLTLLVRSTGLPLPELLFGTLCGKLILAAILIAVLFLIVRMLELRFCGVKPDTRCCKRDIRAWSIILLILLLAALALIRTCENDIRQKDFDLAMVGVHWDGKYPGESGAHLRWGFRYELTFPQGGFDLYRKQSDTGSWTLLNSEGRIHPARVWSGTVPGPDTVWNGRGKDRLHVSVHPRYEGANAENFPFLRTMLAHDPYQLLYFVEGRDEPFLLEADAKAFADADEPGPLARWEIEPMSLLQTMGLHSEVARLLGLYYTDTAADPNQECSPMVWSSDIGSISQWARKGPSTR